MSPLSIFKVKPFIGGRRILNPNLLPVGRGGNLLPKWKRTESTMTWNRWINDLVWSEPQPKSGRFGSQRAHRWSAGACRGRRQRVLVSFHEATSTSPWQHWGPGGCSRPCWLCQEMSTKKGSKDPDQIKQKRFIPGLLGLKPRGHSQGVLELCSTRWQTDEAYKGKIHRVKENHKSCQKLCVALSRSKDRWGKY